MAEDPFPSPRRIGERGEFPEHDERIPRPQVLSARRAAREARERLNRWREENRDG